MIRRSVVMVAMACALLALVPGCGGSVVADSSASREEPRDPIPGGHLYAGVVANPDGFLPADSRWTPATWMVAKAVFDPFAAIGEDGKAHPYLAESIEANDDATRWTIRARPDVVFHNGERLDAEAMKLNLDAAARGIITASLFRSMKSVDIVDDRTIAVTMTSPWAQFPQILAGQAGFVLAPAQLKERKLRNPIGTGPYKFVEWRDGHQIETARNPSYWQRDEKGRRLPYLDGLTFKILPDPNSMRSALRAGDLDLMQTSSPSTLGDMQDGGMAEFRSLVDRNSGDELFLSLNNAQGTFSNRELRRAAAEAIDRKEFLSTVLNGNFEPANGPYAASSQWGESTTYPAYNPEHAKQIVRQEAGDTRPPVQFTVPTSNSELLAASQWIQQKLNEVGFDVKITAIEDAAWTIDFISARSDLYLYYYWYDSDPDALWHFFSSETIAPPGQLSLNFARWNNKKADAALNAARASFDDDERKRLYQSVWDEMGNDVPYVFLAHNVWAILWHSNIHGVGNHVLPDGTRAAPLLWGNLFLARAWRQT